MIARAYSCCLYAPPELQLDVGQYEVMIIVLVWLFPRISIHDQRPRLLNSRPVPIALHGTLSNIMISVPLL